MKLLMLLCSTEIVEDVRRIIDRHEVHGFTEIPNLRGSGETGPHLGSRAFPGTISLIFTVLPQDKAQELIRAIRDCASRRPPGEGVRLFALDAEPVF